MNKPLRFILSIAVLACSQLPAQTLVSQFDFNGNTTDALGNSTATLFNNITTSYVNGSLLWVGDSSSIGGGLVVRIPDALFTENNYSVAIDFQFSEVNGYRKIIDFSDMNTDEGLYFNGNMRLYSGGGYGPTTINANTDYTVLFTRNSSDDTSKAYLVIGNNLSLESITADGSMNYVPVLSGTDRVLHFFHDDSLTVSEYSISGAVSRIRIWNGIATINDINSVPSYASSNQVSLYPNPANDQLNIRFAALQNGNAEIYDAFGKMVKSESLRNANCLQINTADLAPGIYFLRVNDISLRFVRQ